MCVQLNKVAFSHVHRYVAEHIVIQSVRFIFHSFEYILNSMYICLRCCSRWFDLMCSLWMLAAAAIRNLLRMHLLKFDSTLTWSVEGMDRYIWINKYSYTYGWRSHPTAGDDSLQLSAVIATVVSAKATDVFVFSKIIRPVIKIMQASHRNRAAILVYVCLCTTFL